MDATQPPKKLREIIAWSFYDWAMSPFFSVITTFVFATYFTEKIASDPISGTHTWGFAIAASGLIIAIMSPIFGAIADYSGHRKVWLFLFTYIGVVATALLWFAYPTISAITLSLTCVIIGSVGFEIATVFYNAFLPGLAPPGYLGRLSGWAWGIGYVGGICCLVITLSVFIKGNFSWLPSDTYANVRICGPLVAIWAMIFSLPLFFLVRESHGTVHKPMAAIKLGLSQLLATLIKLKSQHHNIFIYLISRMIYTDGLNTLFAFGGIYAAGTFHMSITEVIELGIILNISAGIGAALFGWIDDYLGSKETIQISLVCLTLAAIGILLIESKVLFWLFAPIIGLFVGPVQAASRSLMARLAPQNCLNEMFGLFALSGRATAFIGPWLLALMTYHFQTQRAGMATIIIFFVVGGIILHFVNGSKQEV